MAQGRGHTEAQCWSLLADKALSHMLLQALPARRTSSAHCPTGTAQRHVVCPGCPLSGGACVCCRAICTPGPGLLSSSVLHRCSWRSCRLGEKECGGRRDSGTWPLLCGTPVCLHGCVSPSPGHDFHVTVGCSHAHPAPRPAGSGSSHGATDSLAAGQLDASHGRSCSFWMWPILPPVCALSKIPQQTLIVFFTKP